MKKIDWKGLLTGKKRLDNFKKETNNWRSRTPIDLWKFQQFKTNSVERHHDIKDFLETNLNSSKQIDQRFLNEDESQASMKNNQSTSAYDKTVDTSIYKSFMRNKAKGDLSVLNPNSSQWIKEKYNSEDDESEIRNEDLETGLSYWYNSYLNQVIGEVPGKTFDEINKNKRVFNVGKFTKFLCDFNCSIPKSKITQIFNHITARKGNKSMNLSLFKQAITKIAVFLQKSHMQRLVNEKRDLLLVRVLMVISYRSFKKQRRHW